MKTNMKLRDVEMQVIYSYLQENSKYHQAIFLCQCFRSTAIQVRIVVNKMQLYNICRNDKTHQCVSPCIAEPWS